MSIIFLTTATCIKCKALKPELSKFCEENAITLHILDAMDSKGSTLVHTYNIMQVPTVFLYDEEGTLIKMLSGDIYLEEIQKYLSIAAGNSNSIAN